MNNTLPNYDEKSTSQFSAVKQLINMGYNYLTREEVRDILHKQDYKYLLEEITFQAMRKINDESVSDKSILNRIYEIQKTKFDNGSESASLNIYNMLTMAESAQEFIDGKKTDGSIKIIDWENVENNIYHVTTEYNIIDKKNIRIDIVVFINGIPCAIIENKKPSVLVDEAINQIIKNSTGSDAPYFFLFPQIYIATNITNLKYGTYKTPNAYYNMWKEKYTTDEYNDKLLYTINNKLDDDTLNKVLKDLSIKEYNYTINDDPSEQDIGIYGLLQKERVIDIIKNFILFDKNIKKIARYNQYFAVKKTFASLSTYNEKGVRNGGLIWHTQGSGKSLTMVILAKLILKQIPLARIFIVTDRIDLDEQIKNTFENNNLGTKIEKASSGKDLVDRLKTKEYNSITTTLIHKFNITECIDDDSDIFIFIDEAHRTQDGITHATMRAVMPKACIIGFTGTPLMTKTESRTIQKFNNNLIDTYKMKDAEIDKAVCELIYQGRFAEQKLDKIMADFKFDRITKTLNEKQKQDLIKKYVSSTLMKENSKYIYVVATDIYEHFIANFKGSGLKGQIVAPSKYAAVCFHKWFQEYNQFVEKDKVLNTAVVISDDNKYDNTGSTDDEDIDYNNVVAKFLENIKKEKSLKKYERETIDKFKKDTDEIEILIVVNKLLTGFDAPRNTVLYLVKQLENHNLMQAIARVNRVFDGDNNKQKKNNGLIIDYSANAQNLKDAMQLFSGFNPSDVENMLKNTDDLIKELQNIFNQIRKTFKNIPNTAPIEKYVDFLKQADNSFERELFYNNVNKCIDVFNSCLSLPDFYTKLSPAAISEYKNTLKSYVEIKKATKIAMAEIIDFSKYKNQLKKILDEHLSADEVTVLTKEINISNSKEFNSFIEDNKTGLSKKSQADAIAAQTKKIIKERYSQDEEFYQKFSDIIDDIIKRLKLIKEEDIDALLQEVKQVQEQVTAYKDNSENLPDSIANNTNTHPYFRKLKNEFKDKNLQEVAEITLYIYNIIAQNKKVDFHKKIDIKNKVLNMIQDYFIDELKLTDYNKIGTLSEEIWNIAVANR